MVDEVFESVAAFRCRGEPKPVLGRNSVEDVEECAGGDMVAFVDDHESVVRGDVFDACPAGERRQQCDVDNAGGLGSPTTDLTALEAEVLLQPVAPLIGQCFAVDEDQGGGGAGSDCSAGNYGFARPGWCDQDSGVLLDDSPYSGGLFSPQWSSTSEFVTITDGAVVVDPQRASG